MRGITAEADIYFDVDPNNTESRLTYAFVISKVFMVASERVYEEAVAAVGESMLNRLDRVEGWEAIKANVWSMYLKEQKQVSSGEVHDSI